MTVVSLILSNGALSATMHRTVPGLQALWVVNLTDHSDAQGSTDAKEPKPGGCCMCCYGSKTKE